jgi:hypothetical protein
MTVDEIYRLLIQLGKTIVNHFVEIHKNSRETHFLLYVDELVFEQLCKMCGLEVDDVDNWLVDFVQSAPGDHLINDYVACVIASAQVRIAVELPYAEDSISAFNERMVEKFKFKNYSGMLRVFYSPFQEKIWTGLQKFFKRKHNLLLVIPTYDANNSHHRYVKYPRSQVIINVAEWKKVINEDMYTKYRINSDLSYKDFLDRVFPEFRKRKVFLERNSINRKNYERIASRTIYYYLMSTRGWMPGYQQQLPSSNDAKVSSNSDSTAMPTIKPIKFRAVERKIEYSIKTNNDGSFKLLREGSELNLENYDLFADIPKCAHALIFSYDPQYDDWIRQQGNFSTDSFGVMLRLDHEIFSQRKTRFHYNEQYSTGAFIFLDVATPSILEIGCLLGYPDNFKNPSGINLLGGMKVGRNSWLVSCPPIVEVEADTLFIDNIEISVLNNRINLEKMKLISGTHLLQISGKQSITIELLEPMPATQKDGCGWKLSRLQNCWEPSSDVAETTITGRRIINIDAHISEAVESVTQLSQALERIRTSFLPPQYERLMEITNG